MGDQDMTRRTLLKGGGAALAGMTVLRVAGPASAFPGSGDEDEEVVPWLDQPTTDPTPGPPPQLVWEELDSWYTPNDEFFVVSHYDEPALSAVDWRLAISGLVARPQSLSLDDLKARARREVDFTMECSGNTGLPFFIGGIGNARWAGTRLAPVLQHARVEGTEVVFWGADSGVVTIRDNGGVTKPPPEDPAADDGLTITEHFARSMSMDEAMNPDNLLCYEMNGEDLPTAHGFPVRLIAPGWYGVANVKWLTRIEVTDQRYAGRFMARDYVTIRKDPDTEMWTFKTVSHDRLKSAPAKVTRRGDHYRVLGAAWGAPIQRVEVSISGGPWTEARLLQQPGSRRSARVRLDVLGAELGHSRPWRLRIRSRAIDVDSNVQPTPDDPFLANKVTYWESNGQIERTVRIPAT